MRVELLTHGRHTQRTGIGRYVHELMKHLGGLADIDLCRLRYLPLSNSISPLRQLPVRIENHVPGSIVHFPQITGCALMLWRPMRPAVGMVHDLGPLVCPEEARTINPFDRFLFRLQLAGLRRMDYILTRSDYTMKTVCEVLGVDRGKVRVTTGGIDVSQFQPVPRAAARLEESYGIQRLNGTLNILYVGSEAPRKNLSTLLQAVALLGQRGIAARLIKIGGAGNPGHRKAFLQEVERLGLASDVLLAGWVTDADLPVFFSAADVFVLPSLLEGLGLPVLEAMACGTPVVCSNAGALPEVVGDAGFLVEPHDARGFAEAMIQVWRDGHVRDRLIERGLQRCRLLSWGQMAEETLAVYNQVLHQEVRREDGDGGSGQFAS